MLIKKLPSLRILLVLMLVSQVCLQELGFTLSEIVDNQSISYLLARGPVPCHQ